MTIIGSLNPLFALVPINKKIIRVLDSLIVEDDIRPPNLVIWNGHGQDAAKVGGVPRKVRVVPHLAEPAIDSQNLVLLVHIDDVVD